MALKNPQSVADKWATNLGNARKAITEGVEGVTVSPGAKAAAQQDYWMSQLQASQEKWAAAVGKMSLQDWKTSMTSKGIDRIAAGAKVAIPKMAKYMQEALPVIAGIQKELESVPRGSFEQNKQRALLVMDRMKAFGDSRKK